MAVWNKKSISKSDVLALQEKFSLDALTASIMVRRGITSGRDILYYMEDDLRFQHNPFLFSAMEDAVDRILSAAEKDEDGNGEKVLVFGDRDVDGVTATTVLVDCLKSLGIDVKFRVPHGEDPYGLTMDAVEEFAEEYGSLIITVDCGIANNAEIARAAQLGIDVIVVDHHNPQEEIPSPAIILDAWLPDSGYPFQDISGCAAVYKLVSAIRFSRSSWYKADTAIINVTAEDDSLVIECIKLRNLVPVSRMTETVVPGEKSVSETRLPEYLSGQLILAWDSKTTSRLLLQAFGPSAQFNMIDMRNEISKLYPSMASMSLSQIKNLSKIAKYGDHAPTEIGGFYNIFVTYAQQTLKKENPGFVDAEEKDLQLVTLAAMADVMPMKNENRLFVKKGLASINAGRIRPGLMELLAELGLLGKPLNSTDIGWTVVSNLNAAGRLGQAEIAAELFLEKDKNQREQLARKITELNKERKVLTQEAMNYAEKSAEASIPEHSGNLCVVVDERINKGVAGILAGRLVSAHSVPAIAMTYVGENIVGSMRSCRGFDVTDFLEELSDLFISHGGHNFAAGFSLEKKNLDELLRRIREMSSKIVLGEKEDSFNVDAEIPAAYMTKDLEKLTEQFEPFGSENPPLVFMSRALPIMSGMIMGKTEKQHLKITVDAGSTKWPCIFWNEGARWKKEFSEGDRVDILFKVEKNIFNGMKTLQLNLSDIERSI